MREARGFTQGRYLLPLLPARRAGRGRGAGQRAGPRARCGARRGPGAARGRPARVAGHRRRAVLCVGDGPPAAARRRSSPSRSRRSPCARWPPRATRATSPRPSGSRRSTPRPRLAPGDTVCRRDIDTPVAFTRVRLVVQPAGGAGPPLAVSVRRDGRRVARRRASTAATRPGRSRRVVGRPAGRRARGRLRAGGAAPCRVVLLGSTAAGAREVYDPRGAPPSPSSCSAPSPSRRSRRCPRWSSGRRSSSPSGRGCCGSLLAAVVLGLPLLLLGALRAAGRRLAAGCLGRRRTRSTRARDTLRAASVAVTGSWPPQCRAAAPAAPPSSRGIASVSRCLRPAGTPRARTARSRTTRTPPARRRAGSDRARAAEVADLVARGRDP